MLRADQKLNIMNQYLWPTLIYPFQPAPLNKLLKTFVENVDKIIRSAVKETIGLPGDTPNSMIYSSKKVKGLGIIRTAWECFIQTYSVCLRLLRAQDPYIPHVRNLEKDMDDCLTGLNISPESVNDAASMSKTKKSKMLLEQMR